MTTEEAEIPIQFSHSVKITDTAKGIRIDVHVYANDSHTAIVEALDTYQSTKAMAELRKIPLAPIELKEKEAITK